MSRLQKVGEYLRFHNTVGYRNSEFAVLIVARHWGNPIEWHIHRAIAEKEGVSPSICDAISEGRRPHDLDAQQSIIYDTLEELRTNKCLSDTTYQRVVSAWGEQGLIDLVAHYGYYSTLAMVMNVARTAIPDGAPNGLKIFPG